MDNHLVTLPLFDRLDVDPAPHCIRRYPDKARSAEYPLLAQVATFPRVRYMGSKYRVAPYLINVFSGLSFENALDAFSGSGVVGYALKAMGKSVTTNDFLNFPTTIARATVENSSVRLDDADVERILSPAPDADNFIRRTFDGLYFPPDDLAFLDTAWAHIDDMPLYKRDLAVCRRERSYGVRDRGTAVEVGCPARSHV